MLRHGDRLEMFWLVDGVGWVVGIPSKFMLWDRRVDNHAISRDTEFKLAEYMSNRSLQSVLVRSNQYDPIGEWRRLVANKRISPGWRYTVGTWNMLRYTLVPGRLFGTDWYNPYTETINLYSDIPAIALTEGAYARDVRDRSYPGTYAAAQELPLVGMWHETLAAREVAAWVDATGSLAQRKEARRILHPQYGGRVGQQFGSIIPQGQVALGLTGAAIGHVTGRLRASQLTHANQLPDSELNRFSGMQVGYEGR